MIATCELLILIKFSYFVIQCAPGLDNDSHVMSSEILLAVLPFQSSGQAVTSRALKCNGLTSVVLTSIYCDLFMDPDIFGVRNVERNRRALAPLLLLIGAIAGGVFVHSWIGIMGALWLAAFMKAVMTLAWFFWPAESED